jgi:ubiquinone/menaquinone biosynthesis C-methylase UbiE
LRKAGHYARPQQFAEFALGWLSFLFSEAGCDMKSGYSALWNRVMGQRMTARLKRRIVPDLVWNQEVYGDMLRRYVTSEVTWLDAGCGWRLLGKDLEPLEDTLVSTARFVVGADLEFESLSKHRNITRRVGTALDSLPFPDHSFDLVTCNMVVEHLENPRRSFAELVRVLKSNGALVVHTPNTLNYLVMANQLLKKILPRPFLLRVARLSDGRAASDFFPTFYRANTSRRLRELFSEVGLETEALDTLTAPQPFFRFFAPLAFFELFLMRATMGKTFRRFGADIVIVGRRQAVTEKDKKVLAAAA